MSWVDILSATLTGFFCIEIGRWLERRKIKRTANLSLKYKYVCTYKGCPFTIRSSHIDTLERARDEHIKKKHDRYYTAED